MVSEGIKRLSKDTLIYGFGGILEFFAGLLLLPIFTRIFSPADYGVLSLITTFTSIASMILMMGLNSSVQRYYFDNKNQSHRRLVVSTAFWFLGGVSLIVTTIIVLFAGQLSEWLLKARGFTVLFALGVSVLPLSILILFTKDTLRLEFSAWKFNFLSIFEFVARFSIILYLVLVLRQGLEGNFLGFLIAGAITLIFSIVSIRQHLVYDFSFTLLKGMLRYGIPLIFAGLAFWVISLSDRIFIARYTSLEQLGLYAIGNNISSVILLLMTAIHLAWSPLIFKFSVENDHRQLIAKITIYTLIILMGISVLLSIFAHNVLRVLAPPSYHDAIYVVGLLAVGLALLGTSGIIATGLTLVKKTYYITISTTIAAAANIILNFFLIPRWGIIGAAIATLLAYISLMVSYYIFSQKHFYVPFEIGKAVKILLLSSLFIIVGTFTQLTNFAADILIKCLYVIAFLAGIYVSRILDRTELEYIKMFISRLKPRSRITP